jgi:hypothetical protein
MTTLPIATTTIVIVRWEAKDGFGRPVFKGVELVELLEDVVEVGVTDGDGLPLSTTYRSKSQIS